MVKNNIFIFLYSNQSVSYDQICEAAKIMFNKKNLLIYKNEYEKPLFNDKDVFVSVSHTQHYFVYGLSNVSFGIDIEELINVKNVNFKKIAYRYFTHAEFNKIIQSDDKSMEFLQIWTKKEAYSKYDGRGLGILKSIDTLNNNEFLSYKTIYKEDYVLSLYAKDCFNVCIFNID